MDGRTTQTSEASPTHPEALRLHQQFERMRPVMTAEPHVEALCWCISKGMAGMNSQTSGLAQAVGVPFEFRHARLRFPWNCLPLTWIPRTPFVVRDPAALTTGPLPRLVVSCGRHGILPSLALKRQLGDKVFTVHIQDPKIDPQSFDLVVIPEHDGTRGANVYLTTGALHYVTPERLATARRTEQAASLRDGDRLIVPVLIGGPNGCYRFTEGDMSRLIERLHQFARNNPVRLVILKSNRTPTALVERLSSEFSGAHYVWDGISPNPYFAALSVASHVIVTGDSVSMVTEATATGRPVFVQHLTETRTARRFRHFHQMFQDRGLTRPFEGTLAEWSYEPPNDTPRVARIIRERMGLT